MTDTEKLAELLGKMVDFSDGTLYLMADYLIGKGVTIQRWIPVTERLPEVGKIVLVYGSRGGIYTARLERDGRYADWHKLNSKTHYCKPTHWMPLPEPPKGDWLNEM